MELLHLFFSFFFYRVHRALRKQTSVKVPMVLQSTLVRKNVLTNLNTVNLMLPRLLKWGVKLKPEQLIWYLFGRCWKNQSVMESRGAKTAERHFIFPLKVPNRALGCMNNA